MTDISGCCISTFKADVTPPLGSPVGNGALSPAKTIIDPLSARGIVFFLEDGPVVLCAVDWVQISNGGHKKWCEKIAEAVETEPGRVSVHTLHPHDAPSCDFSAEALLEKNGLGGVYFDSEFNDQAIERVLSALEESLKDKKKATHLGIGMARVRKVASNRRILGSDGKIEHVRFSSCRNEAVRAAPEGLIDPYLRSLSFWDEEKPLASLTYYATHPQSFYGIGAVSCDFVGLARNLREASLPDVEHIHFNGAGGNIAAGKYNNGSPTNRFSLARRLAEGMEDAWKASVKLPLNSKEITWDVYPVQLPLRDGLENEEKLINILEDSTKGKFERISAARKLVWVQRCKKGDKILLSSLHLGQAVILNMPGELFVEYQLKAQDMAPENIDLLCMAAYGDDGPGYIGTEISYSQGGYETGPASKLSPEVEVVLVEGMKNLLE